MYELILRDKGYDLATVADGEEALKVATTFQPDLVFLDIMIPRRNGLDVLKLLRHDAQYNCTHAKIVLLTNLSSESSVSEGWEEDADGYVVKAEIVPTDLFEIIKSLEGEPEDKEDKPAAA
jgi:DNA-binding response OmpR family regulator